MDKLNSEKQEFLQQVVPAWDEQAKKAGRLSQ